MSQAAILVWLPTVVLGADGSGAVGVAPTPSSATLPSKSERDQLDAWSRQHGLELEPIPVEPEAYGRYDSRLVEQIEALLEQARTLSGSLDEAGARMALEQAESLLYQHPELPQAGFLLGEVAYQLSEQSERQGLSRLAAIHRARARALEGRRAPSVTQATQPAEPSQSESVAVGLTGRRRSDIVEVDGASVASRVSLGVGEHHVRVLRRGRLAWAGFAIVAPGQQNLAIDVPAPTLCSEDDLLPIAVLGNRVRPSTTAACPLWVAAKPRPAGGILVALCKADRCSELLPWGNEEPKSTGAPAHPEERSGWPAWATYVTLGVGVIATSGFVLWQAGAFDEAERGPTTWSFGGVRE